MKRVQVYNLLGSAWHRGSAAGEVDCRAKIAGKLKFRGVAVRPQVLVIACLASVLIGCEKSERVDEALKKQRSDNSAEKSERSSGNSREKKPELSASKINDRIAIDETVEFIKKNPKTSVRDIRAMFEDRAEKAGLSPVEFAVELLDDRVSGRALRERLACLRTGFPEVMFWADVVIAMPESEARSSIVDLFKSSNQEDALEAIQKMYSALPEGRDRSVLAYCLVAKVTAKSGFQDALKITSQFENNEEKFYALGWIARSLCGRLDENPDSEEYLAAAEDVRRQASTLEKNHQLQIEIALAPKIGRSR